MHAQGVQGGGKCLRDQPLDAQRMPSQPLNSLGMTMRPQTAPAGGQTSTSPKPGLASSLPSFGAKIGSSVKHKRIRNVSVDLPKHLENGGLQANLVPFKSDEIIELVDGILDGYGKLEYLRLLCLSKGHTASTSDNKRMGTITHERCVDSVVAKIQQERLRRRMPKLFRNVLRHSPLRELELGFSCSGENAKALARGLTGNRTLRKISLAGSGIGDTNFLVVFQVLPSLQHLQELCLPYCKLTDTSGKAIASLIKGNASKSATDMWQSQLRTYRPQSPRKGYDHAELQKLDAISIESNDGIVILDLAGNKLTHRTAHAMSNALQHDAKMVSLNLSSNKIGKEVFQEFQKIMNDHESLQVADLSNNEEKFGKLVKHGKSKATIEDEVHDQKSSPPRSYSSRPAAEPGRQPVDELVTSAALKDSDDPSVTLAERVLKQLFEYESRITELEKRRLQDLKKIRKLGKENDELRDKNEKLMARKYPPANSRAPRRASKAPNETELVVSLTEALQGIEKIVSSLASKKQDKVEAAADPALVKSALLVEDLNRQLISLCDLG